MYCGTLSVNDQDEVGFANSERCEHERRLTLNTDCIYTYDKVMHRTLTETDEYGTKQENNGTKKKRRHAAKRKKRILIYRYRFFQISLSSFNLLDGPIINLRKPSSAGEKPAY